MQDFPCEPCVASLSGFEAYTARPLDGQILRETPPTPQSRRLHLHLYRHDARNIVSNLLVTNREASCDGGTKQLRRRDCRHGYSYYCFFDNHPFHAQIL